MPRTITPLAYSLTLAVLLLLANVLASAQNTETKFAPVGNLDCNGFSKIQKPLRPVDVCTDPRGIYGGRFYDDGHYIGHDEPSMGFYSSARKSGNDMQWTIVLPRERSLPATQTFENYITFWFGLALCDPGSFPQGKCIPDSDANNPTLAGSAFLEMQFYPPGFPPFITQISCDKKHWCASLHINSLECTTSGYCNPNCTEPTNFAFIQRNGVPTGPPGPADANNQTFTPNSETLLMNQGDRLLVTIKDTGRGLMTRIDDLNTGQSGFMVASATNGFQSLNPTSCAPRNFSFRPEFGTARYGNFVPWAALQANVNLDVEIGHFTPGPNGDGDSDDAPCFPGPTVPGCIGADIDFDGTSYLPDWPDGSSNNAPSFALRSVVGGGIGPVSPSLSGKYQNPYPQVQFETDVAASESTCMSNGVGCVVPPTGAAFYPFFSLLPRGDDRDDRCALVFGNMTTSPFNDFGGDRQYGLPNLPWFFGTLSSGVLDNPCTR
jgi:hypothetical protein